MNLIAVDVFYCERMFVILPKLIALHSMALVKFNRASVGRNVQAQVVGHDLLFLRIGKYLWGRITMGREERENSQVSPTMRHHA